MPPSAASAVSPLSVVAEEELRTFVLETLAELARESAPTTRPAVRTSVLDYYPPEAHSRSQRPPTPVRPGLAAHRHGRVWAT
ncbi:MAG: hypothetical protein M3N21_06545 [Actinomycetota bacterium]|nr:hypothetical protein [Actinomycetota bacterium]